MAETKRAGDRRSPARFFIIHKSNSSSLFMVSRIICLISNAIGVPTVFIRFNQHFHHGLNLLYCDPSQSPGFSSPAARYPA